MSDSARSLEPFARPIAGWRQFLADLGREPAVNGLIGFIFAATGPVAVILSVGVGGGLSPERLASWIFGVFFLNSLLTIAFSLLYRRPLEHRARTRKGLRILVFRTLVEQLHALTEIPLEELDPEGWAADDEWE